MGAIVQVVTMKYHIGNGTVYLEDWINVDIPSDNCYLASERPDLVTRYVTTVDNYYGRHQSQSIEKFRAGPKNIETVCDRFGSFTNIPARSREAENILAVQVFEHLSIQEAHIALDECWRVLDYGGILSINVPDLEESIKLYGKTQDPFYIRHILGPKSRGSWGFHCMSYNEQELENLLKSHSFSLLRIDKNIHTYPAICISFKKMTKIE